MTEGTPEGTLSFRLTVPEGYWQSRGQPCRFPPIATPGLYLEVVITQDHGLEVFADGPAGRAWQLATEPLTHAPAALAITLTWEKPGMTLYLDGRPVARAEA